VLPSPVKEGQISAMVGSAQEVNPRTCSYQFTEEKVICLAPKVPIFSVSGLRPNHHLGEISRIIT
jgi:hypothetical protein